MTFFGKIENFFKKVFGSTKWETTAASVITLVAPLLETVVTLTAGEPAAMLVENVIHEIQGDLAAVSAVVTSAVVPGTTGSAAVATNVLTAVQNNLQQLLAAAEIKNPVTQQQVTGIVNTVAGEINAILAAVKNAKAA